RCVGGRACRPGHVGRKDRVDVSATITVAEVRGLLIAVIGVLERYVPVERREAEFANLLATAREFGGDQVGALPGPRRLTPRPPRAAAARSAPGATRIRSS